MCAFVGVAAVVALPGVDGAGVDGAGVDGAGVGGAGVNGAGVDGAGVDLAGVDGAGVDGAGVSGAGVSGAGVDGAGVDGAGVSGAGVNGAGVSGASVDGAGVSGAGVDGAGVSGGDAVNYDDWPGNAFCAICACVAWICERSYLCACCMRKSMVTGVQAQGQLCCEHVWTVLVHVAGFAVGFWCGRIAVAAKSPIPHIQALPHPKTSLGRPHTHIHTILHAHASTGASTLPRKLTHRHVHANPRMHTRAHTNNPPEKPRHLMHTHALPHFVARIRTPTLRRPCTHSHTWSPAHAQERTPKISRSSALVSPRADVSADASAAGPRAGLLPPGASAQQVAVRFAASDAPSRVLPLLEGNSGLGAPPPSMPASCEARRR
eukprot:360917-Chlamydomonas_euryale.AAC.8